MLLKLLVKYFVLITATWIQILKIGVSFVKWDKDNIVYYIYNGHFFAIHPIMLKMLSKFQYDSCACYSSEVWGSYFTFLKNGSWRNYFLKYLPKCR